MRTPAGDILVGSQLAPGAASVLTSHLATSKWVTPAAPSLRWKASQTSTIRRLRLDALGPPKPLSELKASAPGPE